MASPSALPLNAAERRAKHCLARRLPDPCFGTRPDTACVTSSTGHHRTRILVRRPGILAQSPFGLPSPRAGPPMPDTRRVILRESSPPYYSIKFRRLLDPQIPCTNGSKAACSVGRASARLAITRRLPLAPPGRSHLLREPTVSDEPSAPTQPRVSGRTALTPACGAPSRAGQRTFDEARDHPAFSLTSLGLLETSPIQLATSRSKTCNDPAIAAFLCLWQMTPPTRPCRHGPRQRALPTWSGIRPPLRTLGPIDVSAVAGHRGLRHGLVRPTDRPARTPSLHIWT